MSILGLKGYIFFIQKLQHNNFHLLLLHLEECYYTQEICQLLL